MPAASGAVEARFGDPNRGVLRREVGVFGATMLGLGSILGTGIFVSVGIAAEAAGPAVLLAIMVAAGVATCNGLSSAQLAAAHPVSGGTYAYGYRWLHPALGFSAGWMFVCAKTASAATAALGFASYGLHLFQLEAVGRRNLLGLAAVVGLTFLVLAGIRRSSRVNTAIVAVTLLALVALIVAGLPTIVTDGPRNLTPFFAPVAADTSPAAGFLKACALMFVAYTGYGRVATLGEEVRAPQQNIPRAIVGTLLVSFVLYVLVGLVGLVAVSAPSLAAGVDQQAAPLELVARTLSVPGLDILVSLGAVTAMLGVLLNLLLGVSRVMLAMARQGDLPGGLARVDRSGTTPVASVLLVGGVVGILVLVGDLERTWSFSAFTVLIYYAITNLAALRLTPEDRLYPRWLAVVGLIACVFLAFWVEDVIWGMGLLLLGLGLMWHWGARYLGKRVRP